MTQKIKKYKGKLEIIYFKYKKLEKEKEEILIEKFRLEERNKKYYEETLSLQNLEGEMQCFENKVYTKQITQLENHGDIESSEKKVQFKDGENKKKQTLEPKGLFS